MKPVAATRTCRDRIVPCSHSFFATRAPARRCCIAAICIRHPRREPYCPAVHGHRLLLSPSAPANGFFSKFGLEPLCLPDYRALSADTCHIFLSVWASRNNATWEDRNVTDSTETDRTSDAGPASADRRGFLKTAGLA